MKKISTLLIMTLGFHLTYSQFGNFADLLEGGAQDANTYLQDYLEPAFVGLGYGLNSGWYNTGKPHKLLGFDLTFGANLAYIPEADQLFTFNNSAYQNIELSSGSSAEIPTVFGPNLGADDLPELRFLDGGDEVLRLNAPTGLGIEESDLPFSGMAFVPAPFAQIGIGLPKSTEVKLRLLPEQTFGNEGEESTVSMLGVGIMHDIKQWIPTFGNLPIDLSAFFAYNSIETDLTVDPDLDQMVSLKTSGITLQAIASKKLAILTIYGGIGFTTSNTSFEMLGDYELGFDSDNDGRDEVLSDPINFEYSNGGARMNLGARIKLLVLTIHGEYAIQEYNTFTIGLGISVR